MGEEKQYTPPPVAGYRTLSQTEVDLMNRIKGHEAATLALVREVQKHCLKQFTDAGPSQTAGGILLPQEGVRTIERDRIANAEPGRWVSIARTDFQTGYMALVRAVAQPVTP